MKNQALFSLKDKSEKLKCLLLQFLSGILRVKQTGVVLNEVSHLQLHCLPLVFEFSTKYRLDEFCRC